MANLADIQFLKTAAGLGGAMSGTAVLSQTATGITTLTGITINDGFLNQEGVGTLQFYSNTKTLYWYPPNGSVGTAVNVSVSGTYGVQGTANQTLIITVSAGSLPTADVSNSITLANIANTLLDGVSKAESYAGLTRYLPLYFYNNSADPKINCKLWIGANTPGLDTVLIGLDPAGAGGTAATIANETTAPAGVVFSSPSTLINALVIGSLAANQGYPFWVKDIVPSGCDVVTPRNTFNLQFSAAT